MLKPEVKKTETKRMLYELLRQQLENERSSYISHWRELGDFIRPRRPRFNLSDTNRGERKNQKIIDGTGTISSRTLRSGMMGGVTSPARPWFRVTTPDPAIAESGSVKRWLNTVTQRMLYFFSKSNLYNALPIVYGDMGDFGTAAMMVEEDFEDVIRCYVFPIGSYMIANDDRMNVAVFFREFRLTVRQVVMKFKKGDDWSNISEHVKELWERGEKEVWVDICHVVQPNPNYDKKMLHSKYKMYMSVYYERGIGGNNTIPYITPDFNRYLRESGYDYFPVLCPRWEVNAEDAYGSDCPGMTALGDIKQLQSQQKRKAQRIEKGINPAMVGPTSLRSVKASILPGDITYSDEREGTKGFRPAHDVNLDLQHLLLDNDSVRNMIKRAYFEDLFLMLASSDRREITAREIDERHEEKLLQLGPVLEQLNQDLLDPLIDIAFQIMLKQSVPLWGTEREMLARIPPPPDELLELVDDLKVEYTSVMAQAQKLVGISGIERFSGFVGNIAATTGDVSVIRKVNIDQMIDVYADRIGIDPNIIRTDEEVEAIAAAQAKAQQQNQQMEMLEKGAGAAQRLAKADMSGDNALTRISKQAKAIQPAGVT